MNKTLDKPFSYLLAVCTWVSVSLLGLILLFLVKESYPALSGLTDASGERGIGVFFHAEGWHPREGKYGMLPMLAASVLVAAGATLLALPLALAGAAFSIYYAPQRLAGLYNAIIMLLAGTPTVVFGLWGLTELVPIIQMWQPPGTSLLAAVLVLAIMVVPTIAMFARSALLSVPDALWQAGHAAAMSREGILLGLYLPRAWRGIMGGTLLGLARAMGETMAVLMVAGNVVRLPGSVFDPIRTLTANMALEMAYAMDMHRSALFVSGLILLGMVLVLMVASNKWASDFRSVGG